MSKKKYRFTAQIGDQKVSYRNESLEQIRGLRDYLIRERCATTRSSHQSSMKMMKAAGWI